MTMMKRFFTLHALVPFIAYAVTALLLPPSANRDRPSHRPYTQLYISTSPIGDASRGKTNDAESPLPLKPKGVIFDMDGTLIEHSIDFADMRRRIYMVADADPIGKDLERTCVLTLAKQLSAEGQSMANEIFADIEKRALEEMKLMPGGTGLLSFLKENGLKSAVLTRNLEKNVHHMQQMYLDEMDRADDLLFHPIVARDTVADSLGKVTVKAKPNPDGILHVCSIWGCNPSEVIMVGDSANDDIAAANRAGCGGAVLLTQPDGSSLDTDSGYLVGNSEEEITERTPSLCVESLDELKMYLQVLVKKKNNNELVKVDGGDFLYLSAQGYKIEIPTIGAKRI
jgi:phosphoglycolate phosphatase-like HAD superfamily hydrolase